MISNSKHSKINHLESKITIDYFSVEQKVLDLEDKVEALEQLISS